MIFHFGFGRIIAIIIKGNKRLKKLVIKTACITLAVIISISFICFGAIALFFPKSMAGICEKVGLENPVNHDTDCAIRTAIEAIKLMINENK